MGRPVLILREDEIRSVLDMASCIDAVEAAFTAYSGGRAELPAVIHLNVPGSSAGGGDREPGEVHVKAGYIHGGEIYATKFASAFEGVNDGVVLAFDASSGAPAALLFDNGFVTDIRTGAAGGVAARHLARENAAVVAMIGTGAQARYQLEALAAVREVKETRLWGRNDEHARSRAAALVEEGVGGQITVAASVREAVEDADIIVTATAAREPLVLDEWLRPGMHITALGSDGPGKQELDPQILSRADLVVADSRTQCEERGELQHATALSQVVELGEITGGTAPGRTSSSQLTVCDLTGVGVQDVAAAGVILRKARDAGLGETIEI